MAGCSSMTRAANSATIPVAHRSPAACHALSAKCDNEVLVACH